MFNQGFTVSGASLKLLKVGERGVVTSFRSANSAVTQRLRAMGIAPGTMITLKQRFPRFVIQVGCDRFSLCSQTLEAVYVRLVDSPTELASRSIRVRD